MSGGYIQYLKEPSEAFRRKIENSVPEPKDELRVANVANVRPGVQLKSRENSIGQQSFDREFSL